MFSLLARLVIRHPWFIILGWLVLAVSLRLAAPSWDQVTKDDNVRFFPPDYPSVVGQELLERGFPQDASSSQVVLVYEREHGRLTPEDFGYVERVAAEFYQFAQTQPGPRIQEARHASIAGHRASIDRQRPRRRSPRPS